MDLLMNWFDMIRWCLVVLIVVGMICGTIEKVVELMWSDD
jgi:hypothetical protein